MKVFPGFKDEYKKLLTYRESLPTDYRKQNDSGFIVAICLLIAGIILAIAMVFAPTKAEASVDYQCQSDCLNQGYGYGYCKERCEYSSDFRSTSSISSRTDYSCLMDCTKRYLYGYCKEACSY